PFSRPGLWRALRMLIKTALDALSFQLLDSLQLLLNLVHDPRHVVTLHLLLASLAKTVQQILHAHPSLPIARVIAHLAQTFHRSPEITVSQVVIGEGIEYSFRIEVFEALCTVPARILVGPASTETLKHSTPPGWS